MESYLFNSFKNMINELVQNALKKIENPQILINMVSIRVRQLGQGFRPLIAVSPKMTFLDVALKEVGEGKLSFEALPIEDEEASERAKKR